MSTRARHTKEDISDGEAITIAGKVIRDRKFSDNRQIRIRDIAGNYINLKIWEEERPEYRNIDISPGEWYEFRQARGDIYDQDEHLTSNFGKMSIRPIDRPRRVEFEDEQKSMESTPVSDRNQSVLAVDIETISTVTEHELDFSDSTHFELLCIGVGYTPAVGQPGNIEVLFRKGPTDGDEVDLLLRFKNYVEKRDPDTIAMYKGGFDKRHLRGRARIQSSNGNLADEIDAIFDDYEISMLDPTGPLEANADVEEVPWDIYSHGLDPSEWRTGNPNWTGDTSHPYIKNTDIPHFGEELLKRMGDGQTGKKARALREMIRRYTAADIVPVLELVADDCRCSPGE